MRGLGGEWERTELRARKKHGSHLEGHVALSAIYGSSGCISLSGSHLEGDPQKVKVHAQLVVLVPVVPCPLSLRARRLRDLVAEAQVLPGKDVKERDEAPRGLRVKLLEGRRHVGKCGEAVCMDVGVPHVGHVVLHRTHEHNHEQRPQRNVAQDALFEPRRRRNHHLEGKADRNAPQQRVESVCVQRVEGVAQLAWRGVVS